jgi:dTDP-4-amino-4,6-dideoxygalactose transaminase
MTHRPIFLSPPHLSGLEQQYVAEAFRSNWIAPLGPQVDAFEAEFCDVVGCQNALAVSSGTAAIHLALLALGVGAGDEVFVSSFTFSASVNPVRYVGAKPVFIDSEERSWNMDPALLEEALVRKAKTGRLPKAVILVDLYGQTADMDAIVPLCEKYGVPIVEDAAEALGASHGQKSAGTFGRLAVFSFNGNKIITTSGGGMLVSPERSLVDHARKLSTQARDKAPYYQHSEVGYNYRLSNILAAIGRGQLKVLDERVKARRNNFEGYRAALSDVAGISFMPEAAWGNSTRWLTCITLDSQLQANVEVVIERLEQEGIEARRLWKPMHLQPVFREFEAFGGALSERLFDAGMCLPSGSALSPAEISRIATIVRQEVGAGALVARMT